MSPEAGIHRRSSHSRKGSLVESPPSASSRPAAPTTFFLRSERDMKQASQAPVMAEDSQPKQETEKTESPTRPQHMEDSSFGVFSLEDTLEQAFSSTPLTSHVSEARPPIESGDKSPVLGTSPDTLAGRKRKAGHSVNPKIKEIAQRIISSEHSASTSRSSSVSSPVQIHSSGSPLRKYLRKTSNTSLNQPHTPLRFSPTPDSGMFSTPRSSSVTSFRLSDEEGSLVDETGSQAIQSSDGEEEEEEEVKDDTLVEEEAQAGASESNMPQLVMPSIAMPSRRPFTGRGKRMGRLKVLVAGQAGVGKTSLIKSILRSCEDIVHVDPVGTSASSILAHSPRRSRSQSDREAYEKTCQITEFNASTKAYPSWWMEMEESRILKRRKSMGDVVLERNICFVDTPGWSQGEFSKEDDIQEGTAHVATYIEGLCRRNAALGTLSDSDLLQMLSGGGGCQVDAVLYLFGSDEKMINPAELDAVRRLSILTNLIPVISHVDEYSEETLTELKAAISEQLATADIRTFAFNRSVAQRLSPGTAIFAVSSALGDDAENMDASLLMSSEYMQPLVPSELQALTLQLLEPENIQWLRHCAVRKFLQWRREEVGHSLDLQKQQLLAPPALGTPTISAAAAAASGAGASNPSQVLVPYATSAAWYGSRLQAREKEPLAQVRLAKWAEDLQRSLDRGRREQRPAWRLGEGVVVDVDVDVGVSPPPPPGFDDAGDGDWAAVREQHHQQRALVKHMSNRTRAGAGTRGVGAVGFGALDPGDPLGILAFGHAWRRRGWAFVRVLGLGGVLGAGVWWVLRNWVQQQQQLLVTRAQPGIMEGEGLGRGWDWKGFFWGERW